MTRHHAFNIHNQMANDVDQCGSAKIAAIDVFGSRFPNSWPLRNAGKAAYQVRAHTRSDNVALILSLVREGVGVGRIFGKRCRSCSISAWMGSADSPWRACIDYWAAVAGGMRGVERPPPGVSFCGDRERCGSSLALKTKSCLPRSAMAAIG